MISISGNTPFRTNSRARIESQGLTGGSAIQISPGTPDTPLLVAKNDDEVPIIKADRASSQSLFDAAPEPKRFEVLRGAGHNDTTIVGGRAYFERIRRFLDEVAPER